MNTPFTRDRTDLDLIRRRQALTHAIESLRSGATAVLAARCGNPNGMRDTLLAAVHQRIESLVRELQALE